MRHDNSNKSYEISTLSEFPHLTEIDGIDLSNYIRDPNSHNPVVYIHKRTLKRSKIFDSKKKQKSPKVRHKGEQIDFEDIIKDTYRVNVIKNKNHDPIMEHTIQFAKDIIPMTIPPKYNEDIDCYTIESVKKPKAENKSCKCNLKSFKEKQTTDKILKENAKKAKPKCKNNISHAETISQSSQNTNNTVDDTHNQTLSELSEISAHSKLKENATMYRKDTNKLIHSESFEAIAEEYPDGGKIKIHIMNDKEKNIFYENIRIPLVKAIKDTVAQFCTNEIGKELNSVKAKIESYSTKFDIILERLSKIEKKLDIDNNFTFDNARTRNANILEELGGGIEVRNANHSSDEDSHISKRRREQVDLMSVHDVSDELGRGEKCSDSFQEPSSYIEVKPTLSHRKPAKFCWTDAKIN